jgi:hypothetical protein
VAETKVGTHTEVKKDENLDKRSWNIDSEMEIRRSVGCKNRDIKGKSRHLIYRVFQGERSILCEVIVSVILSKKMYMYMWPMRSP